MSIIRWSFPFFTGLRVHAALCATFYSLLVLVAPLRAQTTGTILGQVADPSGASIVGAEVEAQNTGTGLVRQTTTNETGFYIFNALPTGLYHVTVASEGFSTYSRSEVEVSVAQNSRVDVEMTVGAVTETVEVAADAIRVDTRQTMLGATMDNDRVQNLPLNGRNVLQLATLLPGVGRSVLRTTIPDGRGGNTFSVSGSRINENNVLLDGASLSGGMWNRSQNLPSPDSLGEFRAITNTYGAEHGRASGGVFTAVTKSGTNEFHGGVWEFLRNDKLNARNFFAPSKPTLRQNQFGAKLGGPIVRNKTFFFASYQGLRVRQQSVITSFPLTASERQGDFSSSAKAVLDPDSGTPFAKNEIPSSRFDPMAVNYANEYIPLPNQPDGRSIELRGRPTDSNQFTLKGDHNFNSEHRASFRYYRNKDTNGAFRGGISPGLVGSAFSVVDSYTGSSTHNFGPTSLGEFRVSYTTVTAESTSAVRALSPRDLGGNFNVDGANTATPDVNITGRGNTAASFPARRPDKTLQIGGKLSWIKGKHAVKVGAETYRLIGGETAQWRSAGQFTFNGNFTELSSADFMLGRPSNLRAQSTIHNDTFTNNYHFFVQDDFKVSTRLTLNLGLRYEVQPPWAQKFDFQSTIRPAAPCFGNCQQSQVFPEAAPGTVYPGDTGVARGLVDTDKNNLAPRVGLAWDVFGNGKTSVRAAYGIFNAYIGYNQSAVSHASQPFLLSVFLAAPPSFADPWSESSDPFPYSQDTFNYANPVRQYAISPDFRDAYVQQWNLNIQQQLADSWFLQIAYVGKNSHKLNYPREANMALWQPGATARNVQQRRQFLTDFYGSVSSLHADGNSTYNAFQLLLQKRFARGYTLQTSYSFGKSLDDRSRSVPGQTGPQNPFDPHSGEKARSDFDQQHIFSLNGIWDLPFGRGQKFGGGWHPALNAVAGGWRLSGIVRLLSGVPLSVVSGRDFALVGAGRNLGPQRPDVVGEWKLPGGRSRGETLARYFNTDAFIRNAGPGKEGQFGNAGRNIITGPGDIVTTLGIQKRFSLPKDGHTIEFRGEFYDLLNRPNFGNPISNLRSPAFGRTTRAGGSRVVQLALRYDF